MLVQGLVNASVVEVVVRGEAEIGFYLVMVLGPQEL